MTDAPDANPDADKDDGGDIAKLHEAESALRLNAHVLQLAIDAAKAGVWSWDALSNTTEWSDELRRQYAFAPSQPLTFDSWVHRILDDDRARVLARLDQVMDTPGDDHWQMEFRIAHPDGSVRWMHDQGRAERDANGRVLHMTGISLDVTEHKRAQEELRALSARQHEDAEIRRLLFETAVQGIVSVDSRGVIAMANRAVEVMFGYASGQLEGLPVEVLVPAELGPRHAAHRAGYFVDPQPRPMGSGLDLVGRRKDGTTFPIEISLNHAPSPTGGHAIAFVTDISQRKRTETALQDRTAELERRTAQLSAMAVELTVAEQHAREQLSKTLHDGLQQLLFSSKLTLDRFAKRLAERAEGATELLERARHDLDDAIAAARSLAVELFPPMLHSGGLAAGLTWLAGSMRQKYGLTVELTADADADPERRDVRTVVFESIRELLFNVVKHAQVDRVAVTLSHTRDGMIRVTIEDQGVGFNPLVAFAASDSRRQGLGLFSVRERLALLGGRLEIETAPGRGTRLVLVAPGLTSPDRRTVAGPLRSPALDVPGPTLEMPSSARPLTVLIADDHALIRDGLRELFADHPELQVVGEAANGREAVEMARELQPDVIVMDVSMPEMDGVEATRVIHGEWPHIRVFGLSTEEQSERLHAIEVAGAAGYFTKGENAHHLLQRLLSVHSGDDISARPR